MWFWINFSCVYVTYCNEHTISHMTDTRLAKDISVAIKIPLAASEINYSDSDHIFHGCLDMVCAKFRMVWITLQAGIFCKNYDFSETFISGTGHLDGFLGALQFPGHGLNQMLLNFTFFWTDNYTITISKWNQPRLWRVVPACIFIAIVLVCLER